MKRWRRPLILIALLLLAGAVVNVAVAWVLIGAPDSWTRGGPQYVFIGWADSDYSAPLTPVQHRFLQGRLNIPSQWLEPAGGGMQRGLGWRLLWASHHSRTAGWDRYCIEGGWPAPSMAVTATARPPSWVFRYTASVIPRRSLLPGPEWFRRHRDRIPLTPIPSGFAINTLFYTAVLALPLSFFPIRRRLRARRGRCPECGYDLAGLRSAEKGAEGAAPCPECGATR